MKKILLLNGPNLNLLGTREPEKYGTTTLTDIEQLLQIEAKKHDIELACYQSNHEGNLIDQLHQAHDDKVNFILFNPAAYTHTSIALRDALLAVQIPFIEIHITDPKSRENYRKVSFFEDISLNFSFCLCEKLLSSSGLLIIFKLIRKVINSVFNLLSKFSNNKKASFLYSTKGSL